MTPLELFIHSEVRERGPMSFARFMERALYHPEWGYYARDGAAQRIGRGGDFFTNVSTGAFFGRLLSRQFAAWWKTMGRPQPFQIVEAGGLDGRLARDVLDALQRESPECFAATCYALVEPLARLRDTQQAALKGFAVDWVAALEELPPVVGVIFGNELLDALPVHRLQCADGTWREWCVKTVDGRLAWTTLPCPEHLRVGLPEGYHGGTEVSPSAVGWLQAASHILQAGRILFLDYGWTDEEYFQVSRPHGTARGYRKHRLADNILADPGEQDLTAHVRWTALLQAAGRLGLGVGEFIQQGRWLSRIVAETRLPMDAVEIRQFQTLTHPEIMGGVFRVLVLEKQGNG